jgi:hypothetical protein
MQSAHMLLGMILNPKQSSSMELLGFLLLLCSWISLCQEFGISEIVDWYIEPFGFLG